MINNILAKFNFILLQSSEDKNRKCAHSELICINNFIHRIMNVDKNGRIKRERELHDSCIDRFISEYA
jgi:hypothetical protein